MDKSYSAVQEIPDDVRRLARLLDSQFRLGNTRFRFGLDPILGLIPGIGDFIAFLMSGGLVALVARHGASGKLLILMSLNVFLDAVVGSIPILGGIFDFFYKANNRNIRLLEKYYYHGKYRGSGKGIVAIIIVVLLILTVLLIYLIWMFFSWLFAELGWISGV